MRRDCRGASNFDQEREHRALLVEQGTPYRRRKRLALCTKPTPTPTLVRASASYSTGSASRASSSRTGSCIGALPYGSAGSPARQRWSLRRPRPPQAGRRAGQQARTAWPACSWNATCARRADIGIGKTAAVTDRRRSPLNLTVLLGAVEAAPPVAAAEVVGDALSEALGARDVSFLIADYSGRSLIRLSHLYEWGQRSLRLSLEAEIQHRLLPSSDTLEAGQFTLAGWLEPAGDVGGDTFDFSLERDTLHLSMTDAIGHTLNAALLATVLVGALRNARRRGVELAEQARMAHAALTTYTDTAGGFVTGQLVRVDLQSGTASIVNAGHPPPVRIRNGTAEAVVLSADPPFGSMATEDHAVQSLELAAGDRLMFMTDGMLERNAADLEVPAFVAACRHLHPREAVQELTRAVVETCGGDLHDDATVLCFDWHGGPARERDASAGADH